MKYCYIEFHPKDETSLRRLNEFVQLARAGKESDEPLEDGPLADYLNAGERSYFWDPTPEDWKEWNDEWFSTPLPKRHSPAMLTPNWTLGSMLEALSHGDYELVGILEDGARHLLAFDPRGYPYGGTGSLVALVECFGHAVIGVSDGTGYSSHERRTEFWQPRAHRAVKRAP